MSVSKKKKKKMGKCIFGNNNSCKVCMLGSNKLVVRVHEHLKCRLSSSEFF